MKDWGGGGKIDHWGLKTSIFEGGKGGVKKRGKLVWANP